MKKLIIFDCDGVLVDSEIIAHQVGLELLSSIGYSITLEESIQKFTGVSGKRTSQLILEQSGISIPEDFFSTVCTGKILEAFEKDLKPLMLAVLSNNLLKDVQKCVASSSPRERVLRSLQITGQSHFFQEEHIFTSAQVKNGKPAPDLFLFAATQMGYHPKNCIVIEDSVAGIQAAHAAEMSVIAFLGGTHANYEWYRKSIQNQGIPIASHPLELLQMMEMMIKGKSQFFSVNDQIKSSYSP
jgi:HAD superfamily hydrolase (TIGR01509 family)